MNMREHHGYGHGLRPGETSNMNCASCRREDAIVAIDSMNRTWIGGRMLSPAEAQEYWRQVKETTQ